MKRKSIKAVIAASICVFALGLAGCGQAEDKSADNGTKVEASNEVSAKEFSKSYELLINDDDELNEFVPFAFVSSSRAEAMMQVSGYDYKLVPGSDNKYELTVDMTCGVKDSDMYMKRTVTFTGTYKVDGSVYTLEKATNLKYNQETAGQFAATSGEGGADYWGPNGLSFDETFTNEEKYAGVSTGAALLEKMNSCKVTVDGDKITSFEALN